MSHLEFDQENWESWLEVLENLEGSPEKIEIWVDENDNFVTIEKPILDLSDPIKGYNGRELVIRYKKSSVSKDGQAFIQKAIDQKIFGYSYVFSIINPHRLCIHVGMLKSVTLKDQKAA